MKSRILVVDDEVHIVELIGKYLINKGFDILTAFDGKKGISKAKKELPDLTILDVRLPEMDGLTMCRKLREDRSTHLLPVIMLSAKGTYEDKISGIKAGADDYITKPFDLQELLARVEGVLLRTHIARGSNPLTGLPGNPSIEYEITKKINHNLKYAVCYLDLNDFKAYNDKYGYEQGDKIICQTAKIITKAISQKGNPDDFIGHIGGDDFIIITTPGKADNICSHIIKDFDQSIPSFYREIDRQKGYIENLDRRGNKLHFPITSLAIGVVTNERRIFTNHLQVSAVATEMKQYAKTFKISNYKKDRRSG